MHWFLQHNRFPVIQYQNIPLLSHQCTHDTRQNVLAITKLRVSSDDVLGNAMFSRRAVLRRVHLPSIQSACTSTTVSSTSGAKYAAQIRCATDSLPHDGSFGIENKVKSHKHILTNSNLSTPNPIYIIYSGRSVKIKTHFKMKTKKWITVLKLGV